MSRFDPFTVLLLLLALSQCDADIKISNANLFIDTLFLGRIPQVAPFEGLEPYKLEPIIVRVNQKNSFGHKFKANFSTSVVNGLSKVKRLNDCPRPAIRNGNYTVSCNVHFKEIRIVLDGFGEGDTTFKKSHRVQADATFDKTYALIEIAGPEANRPGSLTRFDLTSLNFVIEPKESIGLSSDRMAEFKMTLNSILSDRMKAIFEGKYRTILESAINTVNLPPI